MKISKEGWLNEMIYIDKNGFESSEPGESTKKVSRQEAFEKRGYSQHVINAKWAEIASYFDEDFDFTCGLGVGFAHKDIKHEREKENGNT